MLQQRVARRVSQRIVHLLEPVEVDQHHRTGALLHLERGNGLLQPPCHLITVEEASQRVIGCQPVIVARGNTLRSDVGAIATETGKIALVVEKRAARNRPPDFVLDTPGLQRQVFKARLPHHQEGQAALAILDILILAENFHQMLAEYRTRFHPELLRNRCGDIG